MTAPAGPSTEARRVGLVQRVRRLKGLVLAMAAASTLGIWALVSGTVASTATASVTTTDEVAQPTVTIQGDDGFFGGGSSLGSGVGQPVARSRGS